MDIKKLLAITFMAAALTAVALEPSKVKEYEQYAKEGESWAAASLARAYANGDELEKTIRKLINITKSSARSALLSRKPRLQYSKSKQI